MKIIKDKISLSELEAMAKKLMGTYVKAVVDIERKIMAIDSELHSDEESLLIENGSKQYNLWGINLYPDIKDENWIEFDSMINLRPSQENRSRGVENPETRKQIIGIVNLLVEK